MKQKETIKAINNTSTIHSSEGVYGLRIPQLIKKALQDEFSLKTIIKSPEDLLENLFEGISTKQSESKKYGDTALTFKLKQNSNQTVLLHKRPYEFIFQKKQREASNETAYFWRQKINEPFNICFDKKSEAQLKQNYFQTNNQNDENRQLRGLRGLRLDSTKSCAVETSRNLFSVDFEKTRDPQTPSLFKSTYINNYSTPFDIERNHKKDSSQEGSQSITDESCFKVPKSIVKVSKAAENTYYSGISGQYLGMIQNKQQQLKKYNSHNMNVSRQFQTPQFGDQYSQSSGNSSFMSKSKYIRGPYKKKRDIKIEEKELLGINEFNLNSQTQGKRHQSTIQKAEIARQILTKIEENNQAEPVVLQEIDAPKPCNCSNSGCLKLYCECFKNNRYCGGGCRCSCCSNLKEHETKRLQAKEQILMRNPYAFRSKIEQPVLKDEVDVLAQGKKVLKDLTGSESENCKDNAKRHFKGCNCKRSGCQKKYCECFLQGVICSDLCKCEGCKNCQQKSLTPTLSQKISDNIVDLKICQLLSTEDTATSPNNLTSSGSGGQSTKVFIDNSKNILYKQESCQASNFLNFVEDEQRPYCSQEADKVQITINQIQRMH